MPAVGLSNIRKMINADGWTMALEEERLIFGEGSFQKFAIPDSFPQEAKLFLEEFGLPYVENDDVKFIPIQLTPATNESGDCYWNLGIYDDQFIFLREQDQTLHCYFPDINEYILINSTIEAFIKCLAARQRIFQAEYSCNDEIIQIIEAVESRMKTADPQMFEEETYWQLWMSGLMEEMQSDEEE